MTVEEIRNYAKEMGVAPKKIDLLISELHPDETGKLNPEESMGALWAIDYHVETKKYIRSVLETTKEIRKNRSKDK